MSRSPNHSLRFFLGRVSETTAQLYVQAESLESDAEVNQSGLADWHWRGEINGPYVVGTHTLPALVPFRDMGPGATVLAQTIVPDPCIWTPDCPALYELSVDLIAGTIGTKLQVRCQVGIQTFGVHRNSFYLNSKRFVPRIVHQQLLQDHSLETIREHRLAIYVTCPDEELFAEASRLGVPLFVSADALRTRPDETQPLSLWPAVCAVIGDEAVSDQPRELLLLATINHEAEETSASLGDGFLIEANCVPSRLPDAPIVFTEPAASSDLSVEGLRRQCDLLQQRTAKITRSAGFLILPPV
jgi:hypothetical protein